MKVLGSASEKAATAAQLELIYHNMPNAVIIGSVGRAATYTSFGYDQAPPLDLRNSAEPSGYRDIDVLFADPVDPLDYGYTKRNTGLPHELDLTMGNYVRYDEDTDVCELAGMAAGGQPIRIPLSPAAVKPAVRTLLGAPVRTLSVGTQERLNSLIQGDGSRREKVAQASGAFATFAAGIRGSHPEEFLPQDQYDPFVQYKATNIF